MSLPCFPPVPFGVAYLKDISAPEKKQMILPGIPTTLLDVDDMANLHSWKVAQGQDTQPYVMHLQRHQVIGLTTFNS